MFSLDLYAQELAKQGHEVSVLTLSSFRNDIRDKKQYTVIEEKLDSSNPVLFDPAAAQILKKYENQFDIYHIHNPSLLIAGSRYRKNGGKTPVVADMNTYMFCTNFPFMDGACHKTCGLYTRLSHSTFSLVKKIASIPVRAYQERYLHSLSEGIDRFFPVSPFAEQIFIEYGLEKKKMHMIPDGFDFTSFKSYTRLKKYENGFHLFTASRFDHAKGVDIAVQAIKELKKRDIQDVFLHVIGNDGDQKENIKEMVKTHGLEKHIIFHGHLSYSKLLETYARCHVFIHPARWFETFGRTIVEAMALGLPVIVSNKGALPWTAGTGGLVFDSGDPIDLADKIETLYSNEALRTKLSQNALKRAKDFDVENTVDQFIQVYAELKKP